MKKLDRNINQLLEIICEIFTGGGGAGKEAGFDLWPFHPLYGRVFFTKYWFRNFYGLLKIAEEKGFSNLQLAKAFPFPSQIAQFFWMLDGMKGAGLELKERLYIVEKLFSLLEVWRRDVFCKNGRNVVWTPKDVGLQCRDLYFFDLEGRPALKKQVNLLESGLWLYAELTNFETHPFIHSFQGPYPKGKRMLLYRKYFNLKQDFWRFTKNFKFSCLEAFEIYKAGTVIKLDFFERGVKSSKNYRDGLLSVAFKIDGKNVKRTNNIREISTNLDKVISEGTDEVRLLDKKELLMKYSAHWFYALKPFCDLLAIKDMYRVPKEVEDNVYKKYEQFNSIWKGIEEKRRTIPELPRKKKAELCKRIFDPRVQ